MTSLISTRGGSFRYTKVVTLESSLQEPIDDSNRYSKSSKRRFTRFVPESSVQVNIEYRSIAFELFSDVPPILADLVEIKE